MKHTVFLSVVLSLWGAMHAYVFWRLSSIPWMAARFSNGALLFVAVLLWGSYPLARIIGGRCGPGLRWPIEYAASSWIGLLFLLFAALLAVDVITVGGLWLRAYLPAMRSCAAIVAFALAIIALVQGLRSPVVRDYTVEMPGVPERTLVALTDLHLGRLIGQDWTRRLVQRVNAMKPDLVLMGGDLIDGEVERVTPLIPELSKLQAPMGVWAVTGNHEFYAGGKASVELFRACGFNVLHDQWAQLQPGLIIAGVDDLTARTDAGHDTRVALDQALSKRPAGATILLSHSPLQVEVAAELGVNLMVSGHTHHGQIWPFGHLVAMRYRFVGGRYDIGNMALIVSRGAGTWGPRMRLWLPSEIVRIHLKSSSTP